MNFDFNKFQQSVDKHNVQKRRVEEEDRTGLMTVISHIWNLHNIDMINFDSFTLKDAEFALEAMESLPLFSAGDSDEAFVCDPMNPFVIFRQVEVSIYELAVSKAKIYESDDDEENFI